eukprot:PhF_6_TR24439/c0_g1_i1/m.33794/K18932/ZDHHC; palmitoyltransferase
MSGKPSTAIDTLITLSRYAFISFGYICIVLAITLISAVIYIVFYIISPFVFPTLTLGALIHYPIAVWVAFNIVFQYIVCLSTNPGSPIKPSGSGGGGSNPEGSNEGHCKKCNAPKPERAHHCHMCNVCVLKMDHHCPWINGCVGYRNHRYFALFLGYLWFGTLYVCVLLLLCQFGFIGGGGNVFDTSELLFCFVLCVAIFVAMTFFVGWSSYLILTNQTTIEWHGNKTARFTHATRGEMHWNQYDLGRRRNVLQVFGKCASLWQILLPSFRPMEVDGHTYPRMHGHLP